MTFDLFSFLAGIFTIVGLSVVGFAFFSFFNFVKMRKELDNMSRYFIQENNKITQSFHEANEANQNRIFEAIENNKEKILNIVRDQELDLKRVMKLLDDSKQIKATS